MLGYTQKDLADMTYGVWQADLLVNADENPAIHNYLMTTHDFLMGLYAEGHLSDRHHISIISNSEIIWKYNLTINVKNVILNTTKQKGNKCL